MYNIDFYDKVMNLTCSKDELCEFGVKMTTLDFDTDSPFKKYYKLDLIMNVYQKYLEHEIDVTYLTYWFNAYSWILSGGFKDECLKNLKFSNLIEKLVYEEIIWSLDGLSFYDETNPNIEDFKETMKYFKSLDNLLSTSSQWKVIYSDAGILFGKEDCNSILYNEDKKEYYSTCFSKNLFPSLANNSKKMDHAEFLGHVKKLNEEDYCDLGAIEFSAWR